MSQASERISSMRAAAKKRHSSVPSLSPTNKKERKKVKRIFLRQKKGMTLDLTIAENEELKNHGLKFKDVSPNGRAMLTVKRSKNRTVILKRIDTVETKESEPSSRLGSFFYNDYISEK